MASVNSTAAARRCGHSASSVYTSAASESWEGHTEISRESTTATADATAVIEEEEVILAEQVVRSGQLFRLMAPDARTPRRSTGFRDATGSLSVAEPMAWWSDPYQIPDNNAGTAAV